MTWCLGQAAVNLSITIVEFDQAYSEFSRGHSQGRTIAINPEEKHKKFVALHEMAHVVLGHTTAPFKVGFLNLAWKELYSDRHEVEAHTVAIQCAGDIGLNGDGSDLDLIDELLYLNEHLVKTGLTEPDDELFTKIEEAVTRIVEAGK